MSSRRLQVRLHGCVDESSLDNIVTMLAGGDRDCLRVPGEDVSLEVRTTDIDT